MGTVPSDAPPHPRAGEPVTILDHEGRTLQLDEPPGRVISLVPSASQILLELGAESLLVGRTRYDVHPDLTHLPSVGGGLHPSVELLLELRPDLVIRFAGESDRDTPRALDRSGIPHLAIRPDGISDVFEIIGFLGRAVAREAGADSLHAALQEQLDAVRREVAGRARPRVAYLIGGSPPWAAGGGTFIHELIELAGGENVFADLRGLYSAVSPEELLVRSIDVLLAPEGTRMTLPPGSPPLHTVPEITRSAGPRLGEAARALSRVLHPDLP